MKKIDSPLIIITPVYEDQKSLTRLVTIINKIYFNKVTIIAVDDGSIIHPVNNKDLTNCNVLKLKRNVGHQMAIAIGLNFIADKISKKSTVVVMDSDGEDDPETIKLLIEDINNQNFDAVVASRRNRNESKKFKFFYFLYKLLFKLLSGYNLNFGNFIALKYSSLQRIIGYQELTSHFASTILFSKLRIKKIDIDRAKRYEGKSKMNFYALVLHGFKGLSIFSDSVLVRIGIASSYFISLIVLLILIVIFLKTIGMATPGWFSIFLSLLILILIQTSTFILIFLMFSDNKSLINYREHILNYIDSYETKN